MLKSSFCSELFAFELCHKTRPRLCCSAPICSNIQPNICMSDIHENTLPCSVLSSVYFVQYDILRVHCLVQFGQPQQQALGQ
jgi:hypothetical protein